MKRVLVTGATGFIGRHTIPHLEAAGYEVHGLSSRDIDLHDEIAACDLIRRTRPTHLLHLAWYVPPGKYWTSLENIRWVRSSLNLIVAFGENGGRRLVTAGTCAEYDWTTLDGPCREDETPLRPASLYGTSKDALRRMQEQIARAMGFRAAWGRIFFPYGPGEPAGRLAPSVIASLLKVEPALCSHGRQIRDFIYVEDAAQAFVRLLDSTMEGAVNIGTGQGIAIAEVAETIAELVGRPDLLRLGALPPREGEPDYLVADIGRLESLGFRARTAREGLALTVEWWRRRLGPHARMNK